MKHCKCILLLLLLLISIYIDLVASSYSIHIYVYIDLLSILQRKMKILVIFGPKNPETIASKKRVFQF